MGHMVYDPARGMVYQPDWWEQVGGALQAIPAGVEGQIRRGDLGSIQRQANAQTAVTGDPIVPPPWQTGGTGEVLPPLAGPPAPASAYGPTDAGAAALPPVIGPPGGGMGGGATPSGLPPLGLGGGASGAEDADALRRANRGAGSPSVPTLGGVGGLGGLGGGPGLAGLNEEAAQSLYEDTTGMALRQGFQAAGIDSFKNPYAQMAVKRYAPILGRLMDFFAIASGIDTNDTASMATWVPQFIQQFMSGAINPQKLVQQAINTARGNPILENYLTDFIGPDDLLKIQGATSGYGGRVEAARQNVLSERIARQRMQQQQHPGDPEVDRSAWLDIVRGGGR
jgi:hypothetical protein